MESFSHSTSCYQYWMSRLGLLLIPPPPPGHGRKIKLWPLSTGRQQRAANICGLSYLRFIFSHSVTLNTLLFIFSVVLKSLRCSFCFPIKLVSSYWQRDSQFSRTGWISWNFKCLFSFLKTVGHVCCLLRNVRGFHIINCLVNFLFDK